MPLASYLVKYLMTFSLVPCNCASTATRDQAWCHGPVWALTATCARRRKHLRFMIIIACGDTGAIIQRSKSRISGTLIYWSGALFDALRWLNAMPFASKYGMQYTDIHAYDMMIVRLAHTPIDFMAIINASKFYAGKYRPWWGYDCATRFKAMPGEPMQLLPSQAFTLHKGVIILRQHWIKSTSSSYQKTEAPDIERFCASWPPLIAAK